MQDAHLMLQIELNIEMKIKDEILHLRMELRRGNADMQLCRNPEIQKSRNAKIQNRNSNLEFEKSKTDDNNT